MFKKKNLLTLSLCFIFSSYTLHASDSLESEEDFKNYVKPYPKFVWNKEEEHKKILTLIQECETDFSFPLACAAGYGFMEIVRQLVEEKKVSNLNESLEVAALCNEYEIVKYLIAKGANNLGEALLITDDIKVVKYLVGKGANNLEEVYKLEYIRACEGTCFESNSDRIWRKVGYLGRKIRKKKRIIVKRRAPIVHVIPEIKPHPQDKMDKIINKPSLPPLESSIPINSPISQPKKPLKIGPRKFKLVKTLKKKDKKTGNRSPLSTYPKKVVNVSQPHVFPPITSHSFSEIKPHLQDKMDEEINTPTIPSLKLNLPLNNITTQPQKAVKIGPPKFKLVKDPKKKNKKK